MRILCCLLALSCIFCSPARAEYYATIGEGFSSPTKGAPAHIAWRAFTINTWKAICDAAVFPAKLRLKPSPIRMLVGEKISLGQKSGIVVEATDRHGRFAANVPLIVLVNDPDRSLAIWGNEDGIRALHKGRATIRINSMCRNNDQFVSVSASIIVK
jgi:hypothetical protein